MVTAWRSELAIINDMMENPQDTNALINLDKGQEAHSLKSVFSTSLIKNNDNCLYNL